MNKKSKAEELKDIVNTTKIIDQSILDNLTVEFTDEEVEDISLYEET